MIIASVIKIITREMGISPYQDATLKCHFFLGKMKKIDGIQVYIFRPFRQTTFIE